MIGGIPRSVTIVLLVVVAFAVASFLLPADSDAAIAGFDGVTYALALDRGLLGERSGHHPLFHVIALGVVSVLAPLGVPEAGHVAIRLVAGAGAAVILVLVVRASGRSRWTIGALSAIVLFSTRTFLVDVGLGETIVPGCAAALWVLLEATRPAPSLSRVGLGLVLAASLRQDNVLLVPGIVAGLLFSVPPPDRARRIAVALAASGLATLAVYGTCWWFTSQGATSFEDYLLGLVNMPEWTPRPPFDVGAFPRHVDALSASVVGRSWPRDHLEVVLGPVFIGVWLLAGWLLRGRTRARPLIAAIIGIAAVRTPFFTWFDAPNPEWSVLSLCLVAVLVSFLANGPPRHPRPARVAGGVLLAGAAVFAICMHGPMTMRLRESEFVDAMRYAVEEGRGATFMAHGVGVELALEYLGVDAKLIPVDLPPAEALAMVGRELDSGARQVMVIMDRWILGGDPYVIARPPELTVLEAFPSTPATRVLKWRGVGYAVLFSRPVPESR